MSSPEGSKFDRVGTWTMENSDEIARNFDFGCDCLFSWDCKCEEKFRQILAEFISQYIPEDSEPDQVNFFLGHEFMRILTRKDLRRT